MDDFEGDEFIITVTDPADEKQRSVSPINHLGICNPTLSIIDVTT